MLINLININRPSEMSFEQFEAQFKKAFGREMTCDERRWFKLAGFLNSDALEESRSENDAA